MLANRKQDFQTSPLFAQYLKIFTLMIVITFLIYMRYIFCSAWHVGNRLISTDNFRAIFKIIVTFKWTRVLFGCDIFPKRAANYFVCLFVCLLLSEIYFLLNCFRMSLSSYPPFVPLRGKEAINTPNKNRPSLVSNLIDSFIDVASFMYERQDFCTRVETLLPTVIFPKCPFSCLRWFSCKQLLF